MIIIATLMAVAPTANRIMNREKVRSLFNAILLAIKAEIFKQRTFVIFQK